MNEKFKYWLDRVAVLIGGMGIGAVSVGSDVLSGFESEFVIGLAVVLVARAMTGLPSSNTKETKHG